MIKRLACVPLLGLTLNAGATVVVDYNTPTNNINSRVADSDVNGADTWNFSDTTALIPAGDTGQNGTIYGGMNTTWSDGSAYAPFLRHQASAFQLQVNKGVGVDTSAQGLLIWKKENFLGGADSQTVNFDTGDSLSVNLPTFAATSRELRFAMKWGGTYYVSNLRTTVNGAQTFSIDPASTSWRTITTDGNYTIGAATFYENLDDIEAVGLYWNMARTGNQTAVRFDDFQTDATVIPEPATLALVGMFSLGLLGLRRLFSI